MINGMEDRMSVTGSTEVGVCVCVLFEYYRRECWSPLYTVWWVKM